MPTALPADFYARDTQKVARELLGKRLCHRLADGEVRSGIIVETEAYLGVIDKAAHTYGGRRTSRTETMFGAPGLAYVYLIYGMYHCLNAVTRAVDVPEAVLIRALEPEQGHVRWQQEFPRLKERQWLSGPGRLCRGLKIDRTQNGLSLCDSPLWIEEGRKIGARDIDAGPRVGIGYAGEAVHWPLRFSVRGNGAVSKGPTAR